ncbi:protein phosphatase CheZ [Desulfurivibrio alkaliphilus]|uniref:Putative chemotaxis phosphatase, CheZ n=1 Tax=Desulfurivibrio alkaliphilus (strain DSM 19089 / UNIQEM U267 / AHT2) TaxID=589865 RepID=D6Z0P0_DESAT|nr:protein phosphatase CheZ [Desulfurivibrio alkaliphilus]ADH85269.1 putative chemotaxis phosphatase, CheZ [Desulfurivibrio alkaliphilus AHT 2]
MAERRAEINLEVSTGFFRISTDDLVYNITVLPGPAGESASAPGGGQVAAPVPSCPPPPPPEFVGPGDDYYKQISTDVYNEIGNLAKSLSSTLQDLPAEDRKIQRADLDEAGEKIEDAKNQLRDIVSMTEQATMEIMDHVEKVQHQTDDVRDLLAQLKDHKAFLQQQINAAENGGGGEEAAGVLAEKLDLLEEKLAKAEELLAGLGSAEGESAAAAAAEAAEEPAAPEPAESVSAGEPRRRFLFELDTVFQTIYELCTNEQVKGHISIAREKAAEIFDYDAFVEAISGRVAELEPDDDNFYTVPLSDVLKSLATACLEKKIQNLLVKMEANQGEIFLDSALPLEVPAIEEVGGGDGAAEPAPAADAAAAEAPPEAGSGKTIGAEVAPVREVLAEATAMIGDLRQGLHDLSVGNAAGGMSKEDQLDIFHKIENAFSVVSSIYEDVARITEALSFQDLSGQQILKIIKLLSDFQVQLLAIVVSFGSQLKIKERNADITPEESKRLAQDDVDRYLKTMTGEHETEGPLDQDTVNKMLEEFGF